MTQYKTGSQPYSSENPNNGVSNTGAWEWSSGGYNPEWQLRQQAEARAALEPLTSLMARYDRLRRQLEQEGGRVDDFAALAELLGRKIRLKGAYGDGEAALMELHVMRPLLAKVVGYDVHLQVRQRETTRLPVYYLCRTRHDYWSEHSLIVEDLHLSPGYPMTDERFVRLMEYGHEYYFLRLSPFRNRVAELVAQHDEQENAPGGRGEGEKDARANPVAQADGVSHGKRGLKAKGKTTGLQGAYGAAATAGSGGYSYYQNYGYYPICAEDELLHRLGRHVFQSAWHEDQRLGILAASHLGLDHFRQAIELLYLTLSGDLCQLRSVIDDPMRDFFRTIYPQPAILGLLDRLPQLDGGTINELPQKSLRLYAKLSRVFGDFLRVEAVWGHRGIRLPIYKLLFANIQRFDVVAQSLRINHDVLRACERLEGEAQGIIETVLAA